jgi:eukaryotic-like serine/threonine-protein kinase
MTDEITPKRIGDYEILAVLGIGGMGRVFKVRNVISDRVEAMKILLPDLAGRQELAERFLREIKVLASLNHPNIAALRTALTLENRLVMVMEYVEGRTLAERLEQGAIPAGDALNYIDQVLDALKYAHEQKVIHRDIKPSNMMLTPQGIVKVMDFGIARSGTDHALTSTGTTLGSLYYMSPEQVKGEGTDARSDLYSVGVSLYEMVTGQRPFQADSDFSVMAAHLQQQPKPPVELRSDLPEGLNEIILIAMVKDPGQRFQSATAFRAALKNVRANIAAAVAAPVATAALPRLDATGVLQNIPSAAAPVFTSSQPQVQAQPMPVQTQPIPSVLELSAQQKGHRGLYMALGALIVVAVLVAAGLYIPKRNKAKADSEQTTKTQTVSNGSSANDPTTNSSKNAGTTTTTSTDAAANNANPRVNPSASDVAPSGSAPSAGTSTELQPPIPSESNGTNKAPDALKNSLSGPLVPAAKHSGMHSSSQSKQFASSGSATSVGTPTGSAESAQGSPAQTEDTAQMAELEQQVVQLSSRANAVNDSLNHMRQQQSSQGFGLRADISSAQERMGMHMARAQSALQNGDVQGAKKYLDLAEGEVGKLEKFLGH